MYGVTDTNGVELEPGDSVRILYEDWPEPEYQNRVGTIGKADFDEERTEVVIVTFEDGETVTYAWDAVELVPR